jgi:serine/threonine protein phosphatase PrpC
MPFGCSVIGASHIRKEKKNQDSFLPFQGVTESDGKKIPSIIAVSDGHGGNKYIRSADGSKIAVDCAVETAKKYFQISSETRKNKFTSTISSKMRKHELDDIIRNIKTQYLLSWQKNVDKHFNSTAFNENEQSFLKENCTSEECVAILTNPRLAYGCTFLCAIGYDDLVLILQLGDGDILGLYPNDKVSELIESDPRNIGNETLSLCSTRDISDISHRILIGDEIPSLITLTTDGVKNSYDDLKPEEIQAFNNIPVVVKNGLLKNNFDTGEVKISINKWLEKVTANGAGDDVTIGVLVNSECVMRNS